jgi:hypothetical protein
LFLGGQVQSRARPLDSSRRFGRILGHQCEIAQKVLVVGAGTRVGARKVRKMRTIPLESGGSFKFSKWSTSRFPVVPDSGGSGTFTVARRRTQGDQKHNR